jgi:hypothetical protein
MLPQDGILGRLIVEKLDDGRLWCVDRSFRYYLTWPPPEIDPEFVDVAVGFITDFGSVPRIGRFLIDPVGKGGKPFVVHDKLYRAPVVRVGDRTARAITRAECDQILRDAMKAAGVNLAERDLVYRMVRLGGAASWNRYRQEERQRP